MSNAGLTIIMVAIGPGDCRWDRMAPTPPGALRS